MAGTPVTIGDVARRCGCAISTVSAALNDRPGVSPGRRALIRQAADELGYVPDAQARRLRRQRRRLLGICFDPGQSFQAALLDEAYAAARRIDYEVLLAAATAGHPQEAAVRSLLASRCEGIVLVGSRLSADELAELAARLPVVVVAQEVRIDGPDTVTSRDEEGMGLLVDHLLATGRRDLAYLTGGPAAMADRRLAACRVAMTAHGLADRLRVVPGGRTEADGIAATQALLDAGPLPDAVVGFNDQVAVGALLELRRRGIGSPQPTALAGYDDAPLAASPGVDLTTVRHDVAGLAVAAVGRVAHRLADRDVLAAAAAAEPRWASATLDRRHQRTGVRLVVRGSTG